MNESSLFRTSFFLSPLSKHGLLLSALLMLSIMVSFSLVSADDCIAVPISLSSLKSCSGNKCYFSQTVSAAIPIAPSASICMQFTAPDNVGATFSVNFTIDNAFYSYNAESYYHSDQPVIVPSGCCQCNSISSQSCLVCSDLNLPIDSAFCTQGLHTSPSCGSGGGSYALTLVFMGGQRFKVIKMKPTANKYFQLYTTYVQGNTTLNLATDYVGVTKEVDDPSQHINFTVLSDTAAPVIDPRFVVYDYNAQEDFYFLSSTECNDLDEFNERKFGWYKADDHPFMTSATENLITASVKDCPTQQIRWNIPHIDAVKFLMDRPQSLSEAVAPGSTLFDPDMDYAPNVKVAPNHVVLPYTYLKTGWILAGHSGYPVFFGVTQEGHTVPTANGQTVAVPGGVAVLTNVGLRNVTDSWWYSYVNIKGAENNIDSAFIALYVNPGNFSEYGVCYGYNVSAPITCNNISFLSIGWPDFRVHRYSFNGRFLVENVEAPSNVSSITLETPITSGVLNIVLTFKNLSVQFDSTVIKSRINYVSANSTVVKMNAQSITVGGTCFLDATPTGLIIAQPIDLTLTPTDFYLYYNIYGYTGAGTVRITCYNHASSKNFYASSTASPVEQTLDGGTTIIKNDNSTQFAIIPENIAAGIASATGWGKSLFGELDTKFTAIQWVMAVIFWVVIIAGGILIIIGLFMIFRGKDPKMAKNHTPFRKFLNLFNPFSWFRKSPEWQPDVKLKYT